ncbi:hypothetical protein C7M84_012518, partial [Penaeus vannamei]
MLTSPSRSTVIHSCGRQLLRRWRCREVLVHRWRKAAEVAGSSRRGCATMTLTSWFILSLLVAAVTGSPLSPSLTHDAADDPLDPLYAHVEDQDASKDLGVGAEEGGRTGVLDVPEPTTEEEKDKVERFDPS